MNQLYVITGAPGTGKTSIINELKYRGFACVNEISREIIANQIKKNGEILPWRNQVDFENLIIYKRIEKYKKIKKNNLVFFDRSAIDSIAYLNANNLTPSNKILKLIKTYKFNANIFYTPIWKEIYINDNERKENFQHAIIIERHLLKIYEAFGYKLIKVPKKNTLKRVDFILSKIDSKK